MRRLLGRGPYGWEGEHDVGHHHRAAHDSHNRTVHGSGRMNEVAGKESEGPFGAHLVVVALDLAASCWKEDTSLISVGHGRESWSKFTSSR